MEQDKQRNKKLEKNSVIWGSCVFVTNLICGLILCGIGYKQNRTHIEVLKLLFFHAIFLNTLFLVFRMVSNRFDRKAIGKTFELMACILFSYGAMCRIPYGNVYCYGLIGGWLMSMLFHWTMGAMYQMFICVLYLLIAQQSVEILVENIFIGVGICLLVSFMRKISNVGYVLLIGIIGNAFVIVLRNGFEIQQILELSNVWDEISIAISLIICAVCAWIFRGVTKFGNLSFVKKGWKELQSEEEVLWKEGTFAKLGDLLPVYGQSEEKFALYMRPDFFLLNRLRDEQAAVYSHSRLVAQLAKDVAIEIRADENLCYVGGLYHEVGKLQGKDYIGAGLKLAKQYQFPEELLEIIEQHNVSYKAASSKEAAIVMMTDSVISVLDNMGTSVSVEKQKEAIKRIFRLRMEKGNLDQSGITVYEFRKLENYFDRWVETRRKKEMDI